MKIVLGSQSKARAEILKKMGYKFDVIPAGIDEKAIRDDNPSVLTLKLALAKAEAIIPQLKEPRILITSDQVVVCADRVLEKPESKSEARAHIKLYNKYPAKTVSSVVVTNTRTGKQVSGTDTAEIFFHYIPDEWIDAYIESGDPFQHAGAFDHEHPMMKQFVRKIVGEEASVSGLPMALTCRLIEEVL